MRRTTSRLVFSSASSACPSRSKRGTHGKNLDDRQSGAEAEVQVPQSQSLQTVRTSARVSAEVSALPHLLPAAFARRLHPGNHEGELVAPAQRLTRNSGVTNVDDRP